MQDEVAGRRLSCFDLYSVVVIETEAAEGDDVTVISVSQTDTSPKPPPFFHPY
jgi:hypothetical protein